MQDARAQRAALRARADHVLDLTGQVRRQEAALKHDEDLAAEAKESDFLTAEIQEVEQQAAAAEQRNQIHEAIAAARKAIASTKHSLHPDAPRGVDRQPRPLLQIRPEYPFDMHAEGVSGAVVVDFIVISDGQVRNAFAYSSTRREFEEAAIAAVNRWSFEPGMRDGVPVNVHMRVPIVFSMTGGNRGTDSSDWLPMENHES